jgi:hypothetical protein
LEQGGDAARRTAEGHCTDALSSGGTQVSFLSSFLFLCGAEMFILNITLGSAFHWLRQEYFMKSYKVL